MEEQTQNSENFEIPSRKKRFSAYLLDLIINITGIGLIINIFFILSKRTTVGNKLLGIELLDENGKGTSKGKSFLRYFAFYPTIIFLFSVMLFIVSFFSIFTSEYNYYLNGGTPGIANFFMVLCKIVFISVLAINTVEIFFDSPTFVDKRLGIKRIYKKSKK